MTIDDSHWFQGVKKDLLPGGASMPVRRCVVIHFTAGASGQSSINWWKNKKAKGACAHIVIDRDGSVIQCRPFNRTAGHAGVSRWVDPKTKIKYTGLNACSIGIELANAGDSVKVARQNSKMPLVVAPHQNAPKSVNLWEDFPAVQVSACIKVVQALVKRYKLDDITGHDCIAPERKNDPGPAFPMEKVRKACGFSGLPEVHYFTGA